MSATAKKMVYFSVPHFSSQLASLPDHRKLSGKENRLSTLSCAIPVSTCMVLLAKEHFMLAMVLFPSNLGEGEFGPCVD